MVDIFTMPRPDFKSRASDVAPHVVIDAVTIQLIFTCICNMVACSRTEVLDILVKLKDAFEMISKEDRLRIPAWREHAQLFGHQEEVVFRDMLGAKHQHG